MSGANTDDIASDIRARITNSMSGQSVGIQGVWQEIAPATGDVGPKQGRDPYIVFRLQAAEVDDTFRKYAFDSVWRFHVYDAAINGTDGLTAVFDTLTGDGTPGVSPTYGLNRWAPSVSGRNCSIMTLSDWFADHSTTVLQRVVDFNLRVEEE